MPLWASASNRKGNHMHETKVNTNHYDPTTSKEKNTSLSQEFIGRIETPYGIQSINHGDAVDHAQMRADQLSSLLMLMHGDGCARFRSLTPDAQDSLLWMAIQLARESEAMIDIVLADVRGGVQ
jgi:hypothetical protein